MSSWMVVEDEPDIYEVLLAMFEMWGIDGVAFTDGEDAVQWIENVDNGTIRGELPELALLDIRLPGNIGGQDVAKRLRASEKLGDIAIVLNTAYKLNTEERAEIMETAQADELMYKPLPKFNELQQQLDSVIAKRRARSAEKTAVETPVEAVEAAAEPNKPAAASPAKPAASPAKPSKARKKKPSPKKPISVRKRRNSKA